MRSALFLALVLLTPVAAADEGAADCERDQPWIGYRTTESTRLLVQGATAGIVSIDVCEGEQWDGQDALPSEPVLAVGLGRDVNAANSHDILDPAPGARVNVHEREAYAAANLVAVGRVALYAGTCGAGEAGLEGEARCRGTRELRGGLYYRDNTPGNVVWTILTCMIQIICTMGESDCSHEQYVRGRMDPPSACGRDNTAFGVGLVLP